MAETALREKQLHEWGYRYTWPPTIDNLTPRQQAMPRIAARAERYLREKRSTNERAGRESVANEHYDIHDSRAEWRDNH